MGLAFMVVILMIIRTGGLDGDKWAGEGVMVIQF